jgi:outer membrane immunogenic protein
MKNTLRGAAALALIFAAGAASAADFPHGPYFTAPAPIGAYSWTGPYLGLNLGYQWASTTNNPTRPSGVAGGIQGGYNWQIGQFVLGGEADLQLSAADDVFAPWKFANPWFGTLRGRAGFALNNILVYGTLGLAAGGVRAEIPGLSESKAHIGWAAGAGLEVGLAPNWSARAEYLFIDLADRSYSLTGANNGLESSLFRLGVNYRF